MNKLKNKLRAIVAIAMMLIVGFSANAYDFESGGIYYNITSSVEPYTVEVTYRGNSYNSYSNEYSGIVVIPESITYEGVEYSVTSIGDSAFYCCDGLTSIEIPNSVTSIGENAFSFCSGLTSVTIGNSVTSIGDNAFSFCSGLTSVTIGNSVTSIGEGAFNSCSGLTSIKIPNSVTSIGDYAFEGCFGLTSIEIPNSVTSIGAGAFEGCFGLTSIEIPNSVTSIGNSAFVGCDGLTSIEIPGSVTSIGNSVFQSCSGLTSVVVEEGNSVYDSRENCNAIIETETNKLIAGCKNSFIPNSVTSIGSSAFYYCTGLTSIEIPSSVTSIGDSAFWGCDGLTSVYINDLEAYCNIEFDSYSSNPVSDAENLYLNESLIEDLVIPEGVTKISDYLFSGLNHIKTVTIPNSVTSIGDNAFSDCFGLTSIVVEEGNSVYDSRENCNAIIETETNKLIAGCKNSFIPNSVTSIGSSAFSSCSGLTGELVIPNLVTSIGDGAFSGCSGLTSVTIGNSVTSIGSSAFAKCEGLTSIKCLAEVPPTLGYNTFYEVDKFIPLYVPYGCKSAYQSAEYWNEFTNIIEETIRENLYMDFSESTDGFIYDGWTCWGCGKTPKADVQQFGFSKNQPAYLILGVDDGAAAFSVSSFNEGGAADEWLVSPAVTLPVNDAMLSFTVYAFGNRLDSKYEVYVSETGNTAADFEGLDPVLSGKLAGSDQYVENEDITFALNGYKDKQIYIAFVNKSTNAMLTGFSNINISEYICSLTNNTEKFVVEPGSYQVSMSVEIQTLGSCAGFTAKLEASNGMVSEYVETKELNNSIKSFTFEFPDAIVLETPQVVTYTVTITPNYKGATSVKEEYTIAYENGFPRKIVMELATGAWCGWSVLGHAAMEKYADEYPENFIGIAVHNGDGMEVPSYDQKLAQYISGFPNGVFNRIASGAPYDESYIKAILKQGLSPIKVDIVDASMNVETQKGYVKYAPQYAYDIDGIDITAVAVILEDGCKGRGSYWRQTNYLPQQGVTSEQAMLQFGFSSEWWPYIQPYAEAGSYINDMVYNDVAWGIFNDFYGSGVELPTSWKAYEPQEFTLSFDIPESIQNPNNTSIVVMILDKKTGEILTADEIYAEEYGYSEEGSVTLDYIPLIVDPADGAIVPEIQCIEITTDTPWPNFINGTEVQLIGVDNGFYSTGTLDFSSSYTSILIKFNEKATEDGTYQVIIPENTIGDDTWFSTANKGGRANPELIYTYIIGGSAEPEIVFAESIKDAETYKGTTIEVPVVLNNENEIIAFQCNLYLSDGLSIDKTNGVYDITLTDRKGADHQLSTSLQQDGSIKLLCYSIQNLPFSGNDGALFNIRINVADEAVGEQSVSIRDIILTTTSKKYTPADISTTVTVKDYTSGDANGDACLDVMDIVYIAQYIHGNAADDFLPIAGDYNGDGSIDVFDIVNIVTAILNENAATEVYSPNASREAEEMLQLTANVNSSTIAVGVDSNESLSAYQMDLYLPNGVEVINITSNDATHSLSYKVSGNKVRVISYSLSLAEISDNANLFNIELSSNVSEEILINNILFSDSEGHGKKAEAMSINPSGIDNVNGEVSIYTENGKIVIESSGNGVADVVSVDGVARRYAIEEGRNEISVSRGIYIVKTLNRTVKVMM